MAEEVVFAEGDSEGTYQDAFREHAAAIREANIAAHGEVLRKDATYFAIDKVAGLKRFNAMSPLSSEALKKSFDDDHIVWRAESPIVAVQSADALGVEDKRSQRPEFFACLCADKLVERAELHQRIFNRVELGLRIVAVFKSSPIGAEIDLHAIHGDLGFVEDVVVNHEAELSWKVRERNSRWISHEVAKKELRPYMILLPFNVAEMCRHVSCVCARCSFV